MPEPSPPSSPPTGVAPPVLRPAIPFSTLVPTETCTPSIAAKGIYQVLGACPASLASAAPCRLTSPAQPTPTVLATRDTVAVRQAEPFGEILISLKEPLPPAAAVAAEEPMVVD